MIQLAFLLFSFSTMGQGIEGPLNVLSGATEHYTYSDTRMPLSANWTLPGGGGVVVASDFDYADINWTQTGTFLIRLLDWSGVILDEFTVTVTSPLPPEPPIVPPTLTYSGGIISSGQIPDAISASGASGGTGSFAYYWEDNSSGSFMEIPGENSLTYTPPALINSRKFRIRTESGTQVEYSNVINIKVELLPGTITSHEVFCLDSENNFLYSDSYPSGSNGSFTKRWMVSTYNYSTQQWSPFTQISGASSYSYSPPATLTIERYKLRYSSDGLTAYSNVLEKTDFSSWYVDSDSDGFGDPVVSAIYSCEAVPGRVTNNADCNDSDPLVNPNGIRYWDEDLDGFGNPLITSSLGCSTNPQWVTNNLDCDDTDATLNPNTTWYDDADEDGFGDAITTYQGCESPSSLWVRNSGDGCPSIAGIYSGCLNGELSLTSDISSIIQSTAYMPVQASVAAVGNLSDLPYRTQVQYYDGLGRLSQFIGLAQTPAFNDLVTVRIYDQYGREPMKYLPYCNTTNGAYTDNPEIEQGAFYQNPPAGIASSSKPFAKSVLKNSLDSRALKQGAPGEAWQPIDPYDPAYDPESPQTESVVGVETILNSENSVREWVFQNNQISSPQYFPAGVLEKTITTDEDGNQTIQYVDALGHVLLKRAELESNIWADTYYIYDVHSNLRIVLPPMATDALAQLNWIPTTEVLKHWAFTYEYDGRNRMIAKQVPGADTVYMVYDQWDRLVLTQDGNQRANDKWLFTKYDALNRPIITGIMTETDPIATVRGTVAAVTERYDTLNTSLSHGYSNDSYPSISGADILTVTYYDNYDFMNISGEWPSGSNPGFDYFDELLEETVNSYTYEQDTTENTAVKGQVTGSKTRNLQTSGFINTVTYYDKKYRVIQTISTNVKGGYDRVSNLYDFIGQVLQSKTVHYDSDTDSSPQEITRRFEYDHGGRLSRNCH